MDDSLARFQTESIFASDLLLSAIDVGADPKVDADSAGVQFHAFLAVVHVLEVFLEERDVDDFAGDEVGVVEGGGEGFGVGVRSVTLGRLYNQRKEQGYSFGERREKSGQDLPPAVPSVTFWVPEQPKEVVSEGPSG